MPAQEVTTAQASPAYRPSRAGQAAAFARRFARTKPLATIGAVIAVGLGLAAIFAPFISPYDPVALHYTDRLVAPNLTYFWGTDHLGRDVMSRVIFGTRVSLYVGILAVTLGQTGGGIIGILSGYFGGKLDVAVQRVMDALMAFPTLILGLMLVAALGPSVENIILAIAIVQTPLTARVARAATIAVRGLAFVDAARAIGADDWRIVFRHVLPQTLAPFIVIASIELPHAILVEASLSFLGLGIPPPAPSWGSMLAGEGGQFVTQAPWLAIFPGVAISLTVFAFNMLGDGLRDVLDPRLRS